MKLNKIFLLCCGSFLFLCWGSSLSGNPNEFDPTQQQIDWLINRQDQFTSGLLDSFEGDRDTKAYTFDQALAIIAFTQAGHISKARKILNKMEFLQTQDTEGVWLECYFADDPNTYAGCYKHVTGPVAWMVIAINFYEDKTNDLSYAPMARQALAWMNTMQFLTPGQEKFGALGWSDYDRDIISTEHQLDAYAAYHGRGILEDNHGYLWRSTLILNVIIQEMWAPSANSNFWHDKQIFWRGLELTPNFCTDAQSWGVLSVGASGPSNEPFFEALCWLLDPIDSTRTIQDFDETITRVDGYRGCTGDLNYIEVDFTEHVAAAFYSIGDDAHGDYFHNQMRRIVSPNGGLIHIFSSEHQDLENRFHYVASAVWYYFNEEKINPFVLPSVIPKARAANINRSGLVDFNDYVLFSNGWLTSGSNLPSDLNRDGYVNLLDFAIISRYWLCGCLDPSL